MLQLLKDESSESVKILTELSASYDGVDFQLYRSNDVTQFITCFVAAFRTAVECIQQWENINSAIAVISQRILRGDAAPWNLYLLISTPESLSKDVKYKIENDRYGSRKITIAHYELPENTSEPYFVLLDNIIFARDLTLTKAPSSNSLGVDPASAIANLDPSISEKIKKFIYFKDGLIPQDKKPGSIELRKQYVREMISLTVKP